MKSPYRLPFTTFNVCSENLALNQTISLSWFFFFFLSHHLSAWQCNDIARRNYLLVTPGSEKGRSKHTPTHPSPSLVITAENVRMGLKRVPSFNHAVGRRQVYLQPASVSKRGCRYLLRPLLGLGLFLGGISDYRTCADRVTANQITKSVCNYCTSVLNVRSLLARAVCSPSEWGNWREYVSCT